MSDSGNQLNQSLDKINYLLSITSEQEMSQKIYKNIPILFQIFNSFKTKLNFNQITSIDIDKVIEALKFVDTLNLFMEENEVRKFKEKMMEIKDLFKRRNYDFREEILRRITYTEMTIINHRKLYFRNLYFNDHVRLSEEIENDLNQVYKGNKFDLKLFKQMQNIFWVVKNVIEESKKKELDDRLKIMKDESHKIKEKKYGGNPYSNRGYPRNDNYINDYDYKGHSGYDYNDNFIRNDDNNYYNKNYVNKSYHYGRGGYMNNSSRKYYIKKQEEKEIEIPSDPSYYYKGKESDLKLDEISENNINSYNNIQRQENANDNLIVPENNNINGGNDLEGNNNINEINQINQNGGNGEETNNIQNNNNNINMDLNQNNNENNGGNGETSTMNINNNKEENEIKPNNDIEIISGNPNIPSYNKNKRKSYPNKMIAIELPANEEINQNNINEESNNNGAKIENSNNVNNNSENRYISNNYNYNHNGDNNIEYRQYNNDYRDNKYKNYYYNNGYKSNPYNKSYRNNYNNSRYNMRNNLSGNNYGDNNANKRLLFVEIDANNNPIENKTENNEIINGQEKEINDNTTQTNNNEPNGEVISNENINNKEEEKIDVNENKEEEKVNINNEITEQKKENEQQPEQINDIKNEDDKKEIEINNGENKETIKEEEKLIENKEENKQENKEENLNENKLENIVEKKEEDKKEKNLIEKKEENLNEKKEEADQKKTEDIKTISENINLNPEEDIVEKISKSDSNINKIEINEIKNPEFNIPELDEENLHEPQNIPQENEEISEEEDEMPENLEGEFKAFMIESGAMEPKGSYKLIQKNNNSEENEENENNEIDNNFDENDLDEHINADIENDNLIGMNDVEQEKEIKLKECLEKLNIHKIIVDALEELEEERKLRLKILHKLDDNYKNEAINPKYTLYKNEFFKQNSQMFSNELMDQIKEYNSNPAFSSMPLYNYILMRHYNNFPQSKDNDIINEYINLKTKEIEHPDIIWNNMQDFEKKILIPLYQKTIEIRKKKYNSLNHIYSLYERCIKNIFQNSKDLDEVQKFGAFSNTFMIDYGETDIDICLVPKCNITYFRNTYVDKLIHGLKNSKLGTFREIEKNENHNSCIILKGEYIDKNPKLNININIVINNKIPIYHSILLRLYALYDQRFHIMGIYLKYWAKINGLYGSSFLPSYALLFMIIHFLQKVVEPKVLPNLQKIPIFDNEKNITEPKYGEKPYEYSHEYKIVTTNLYYEYDAKRIKEYMSAINNNKINKETVTNLLVKFFEYYAYCYDSNQKISINKDLIESIKKGDDNISFSIEDPFDIMTNPGKNLEKDSENSKKFVKAMKKEVNLILSGEYVKRFEYEKERITRINKK